MLLLLLLLNASVTAAVFAITIFDADAIFAADMIFAAAATAAAIFLLQFL